MPLKNELTTFIWDDVEQKYRIQWELQSFLMRFFSILLSYRFCLFVQIWPMMTRIVVSWAQNVWNPLLYVNTSPLMFHNSFTGFKDTRSAPTSAGKPKPAQTNSVPFEVKMADFPELGGVSVAKAAPPVAQKECWGQSPPFTSSQTPKLASSWMVSSWEYQMLSYVTALAHYRKLYSWCCCCCNFFVA